MSDSNRHLESDEPEAPDALVAALRASRPEPLFTPPTLDESILREAHRRLAPRRKPPFNFFRVFPWLAAATAIVLAISFVYLSHKPRFAREDLNHDGKVDILDAFILAKQIKAGTPLKAALDMNGDGVIDHRDFETIAAHAVKLDKGDRS
jgi:hypothetical protein